MSVSYFKAARLPPVILVLWGMAVVACCAYLPENPDTNTICPLKQGFRLLILPNIICSSIDNIAMNIFRTRLNLHYLFIGANIIHLFESFYAVSLCYKLNLDLQSTLLWFIQTILIGYPSLKMLQKKLEMNNKKQ